MPTPIPQTTLSSSQYVSFGQNGYYASGFIQIANGAVDVIVNQTNSRGSPAIGISGPVLSPNLTAGQYTFSKGEGTFITGVQIRPANGALSTPGQIISGMLYEPSSAFIIPIAASTLTQNIGAAMVIINQQTLAAPAASVSFSNIPQTYPSLILLCVAYSDQAGDQTLLAQFNNDAGANYDFELSYGIGAVPTAASTIGATAAQIGVLGQVGSNRWSMSETRIPYYAATVAVPHPAFSDFMSHGGSFYAGVSGISYNGGATAITSIKIFPAAGNLVGASTFTLYGG